jgi:altronate dehydratase small subunit
MYHAGSDPASTRQRVANRLIYLLHPNDNVATALVDLAPGTVVERASQPDPSPAGQERIEVRSAIPFGHKIALVAIGRGQPVIKYGEVIGLATADIAPGEHVHVHNVESQRGRGDLARSRGSSGG